MLNTVVLVSLCLAFGTGVEASAQERVSVRWADGRLSVQAANAPLSDVIAEVARATQMKVVGADKLQGPITIDLKDATALDALKELLAGVNYFMQREPEGAGGFGFVLHIHSMAGSAAPSSLAPLKQALHVPALDAIVESEQEDLDEQLEDEADDPDSASEKKDNVEAAQQLVLDGAFSKATVAALERYITNPNPEIRLEAAKALSQRPIAESIGPFFKALEDDDIPVRRVVIDALGHATDAESLQRVGVLLEKHSDVWVRYSALRIFAIRADIAAIDYLSKVVNDEDRMLRDAARQMVAELKRLAKLKQPPPR